MSRAPPRVNEVAGSFDEMAERLERTVSAQREFVANASHQLRTPLTGMKLRLESTLDMTQDPDLRRQLEAAEAEVDRLSVIVDRLLVMARHIEEGARDPRRARARRSPRPLDRWATRGRRARIPRSPPTAGRVAAHADPTDVDQILDNLLDNAIAYAPGPIELTYGSTGGRAWVSVRDHGPASRPRNARSVTERFYRGSGRTAGGSGLGLAIARELVEKWGGTMTIAEREGGGTVITASFPESRS